MKLTISQWKVDGVAWRGARDLEGVARFAGAPAAPAAHAAPAAPDVLPSCARSMLDTLSSVSGTIEPR